MPNEKFRIAAYDQLTDLPNMSLLNDRLNKSIELIRRDNLSLAIISIKITGLENMHQAMIDEVLKDSTHALNSLVRSEDTVSYYQTNNFVVLLPRIKDRNYVTSIALRFLERLKQPFTIEHKEIYIHPELYIAIFPEHGDNATKLYANCVSINTLL